MNTLVGTGAINGQSNVAGLRKFRLIAVDDIKTIQVDKHRWNVPSGGIELRENAQVVSLQFTSGGYQESLEQTEQGEAFRATVEIEAPKDLLDRTKAVNSYRGKRFVGLLMDKNGTCKVLGNTKQPLRFVGCVLDNTSAWKLQFGVLCRDPSFYTDSIQIFNVNTEFITL